LKRNRDLRLLLWGNGVSTFGTSVYLVTVLLLLKDLTESAFVLGLFQFTALIPGFLLSPVVGVVIDRSSRRRILIQADVVRGLVMSIAAGALFIPAWRTPALVLGVSAVVGMGNAFFVPAAQALIPDIVSPGELQSANGVRAASNQSFNLAGNAVGGVLYTVLGAPLVFLLNGITFLLSAMQEGAIRAEVDRHRGRSDGVPDRRPFLAEAGEGLTTVMRNRWLRVLFVSQAGLFMVSPTLLLALPFIVIDELHYTGGAVGFFFAVSVLGGIVMFLAARRIPVDRLLKLPVVSVSYAVIALLFILLGVVVHEITLLVAAFSFGITAGAVYLYGVTWIQARTGTSLHGRLFALLEAGNSLVAPVSYVLTGLVLEVLGPDRRHWLFLAMGVSGLIWALYSTFVYRRGEAVHSGTRM
jgi:MFS transporter, DHA3 family, macrolide efflux protein